MNEAGVRRMDLRDYFALLRRRLTAFLIPAVLVTAIGVPIILLLPAVYRSNATVLIENQDIPRDLVRSTVSTFAVERLEVITRHVMTTRNLAELIEKLNLFREFRDRSTTEKLAERVRDNFAMRLIEANFIDSRSGQESKATIAFTLSFDHPDPEQAQAVVNELVSLYIEENRRSRQEKAAETTNFLASELRKTEHEVAALESELAEFKRQHAGNLPDQTELTARLVDRVEVQQLEIENRLQILSERKAFLETEIARIEAVAAESGGGRTSNAAAQLAQARAELARLRSRYSDEHPDVRRVARQVAGLSRIVARQESRRQDGASSANRLPADPGYVRLRAELQTANAEIESLGRQREIVSRRLTELEQRVTRAPQIEREYHLLRRRLEDALAARQELRVRLQTARLGETLELERLGERFSLIDPADRPDNPVRPNRPAFMLIALVFALTFGAGSVGLFEALDQSIRNPRQLAIVTGTAPLVVVPTLISASERRRRLARALTIAGIVMASVIVVGYLASLLLPPLDEMWAGFEARVHLWLRDIGY